MSRRATAPADPLRAFTREVSTFGGGRHQAWRVFADFCEMAALSLQQQPFKDPAREARYLALAKPYDADEMQAFSRLLSFVIAGLDAEPCDFLGRAFQELELANHWRGQFFTPWALARCMAEMHLGDAALFEALDFVTVNDPACGAGVMLLAFADAVHARGINPQERVYTYAQDVDSTAAHMCFIQLALTGQPATVVIGNTLTLEVRDTLLTPAHHFGLWQFRLARREQQGESPTTPAPTLPPVGQLTLFGDTKSEAAA
jgi:hypothetical protein